MQEVEPVAPQRLRALESSDSEGDAPDFGYLLNLPASTGSHFLLKSEHQRFNQDSELEFSKHFKIDTHLINLAMKSIPFNEKQNVRGVQWNSTELLEMAKDASHYAELYREALEHSQQEKEEASVLAAKIREVEIQPGIHQKTKPSGNPGSSSVKTKSLSEPTKEKESMQEWLDDILDM